MICKFCSAKPARYDKTNHRSIYKADVGIDAVRGKITLYGSRTAYEIPARFCPVCGRDLSKPPVRYSERVYSNTIRENIKKFMERDGLTYSALSKETGIAKSTICDFLRGNLNSLSAGKIALISDALGLPIERLFLPYGEGQTYEDASYEF